MGGGVSMGPKNSGPKGIIYGIFQKHPAFGGAQRGLGVSPLRRGGGEGGLGDPRGSGPTELNKKSALDGSTIR